MNLQKTRLIKPKMHKLYIIGTIRNSIITITNKDGKVICWFTFRSKEKFIPEDIYTTLAPRHPGYLNHLFVTYKNHN